MHQRAIFGESLSYSHIRRGVGLITNRFLRWKATRSPALRALYRRYLALSVASLNVQAAYRSRTFRLKASPLEGCIQRRLR